MEKRFNRVGFAICHFPFSIQAATLHGLTND
jgi:hypothetical protein